MHKLKLIILDSLLIQYILFNLYFSELLNYRFSILCREVKVIIPSRFKDVSFIDQGKSVLVVHLKYKYIFSFCNLLRVLLSMHI